MAGADMAETVEDAEIGEDTAAGHDVFDQGRVGAGDRINPGLGMDDGLSEQRRKRHRQSEPYRPNASLLSAHGHYPHLDHAPAVTDGAAAGTTAQCPRENESRWPA